MHIMIIRQRQSQLLQIVLTLRATCGFSRLLYSGKQKSHQDGNDGNHHQQFDQRKACLQSMWTYERHKENPQV